VIQSTWGRSAREKDFGEPWTFFCYLAVFLFTYSSCFTCSYAFLDDYKIFEEALTGKKNFFNLMLISGRPMYALLNYIALLPLQKIGDMRLLRLISVIGIAILAWLVYRILTRCGLPRRFAFLLGIFIGFLPPFQVYASWSIACYFPYAAILSGMAFWMAEGSFLTERLNLWQIGAAIFLLFLAMTIYQPAAMFFWVFVAIISLVPSERPLKEVLSHLAVFFIIGFIAAFFGYVVVLLFNKILLVPQSEMYFRARLVNDLSVKASWFFSEVLLNAANLVKLVPSPLIAVMVGLFTLTGLGLQFRSNYKTLLAKLGIACLIVPLAYLPNLVIAENFASYRTQTALTSLLSFYFFFACLGFSQLWRKHGKTVLTAGLALVILFTGVMAAYQVNLEFVIPQSVELAYIKSRLQPEALAQARSIYFIAPHWSDSIAPVIRYDEFGLISSFAEWVPLSLTRLILRETSPTSSNLSIMVVKGEWSGVPPPRSVVVDMRLLKQFYPYK
jgi:hypothetical protein